MMDVYRLACQVILIYAPCTLGTLFMSRVKLSFRRGKGDKIFELGLRVYTYIYYREVFYPMKTVGGDVWIVVTE